jgi:hypothetical protein
LVVAFKELKISKSFDTVVILHRSEVDFDLPFRRVTGTATIMELGSANSR